MGNGGTKQVANFLKPYCVFYNFYVWFDDFVFFSSKTEISKLRNNITDCNNGQVPFFLKAKS